MEDVWQFLIDGKPHQLVLGPGDWFGRRPRWLKHDDTVIRLPFYIRRYHAEQFSIAGHEAVLAIGTKPLPFRQRLRVATGRTGLWTGLAAALVGGLVSGPEVGAAEAYTLGYLLGGPVSDRLVQELFIDGISLGQRIR